MTFAFCLASPASLTRGKSCTSTSQPQKTRGDVPQTSEAGAVRTDASVGCHSAEGTRYSSGQSPDHSMHSFTAVMLNILNDWFFCQVRTHSQTQRSSQDKACPGKSLFLFWHCSSEQEGTDPRTVTAGVCLWRRFKTQT